VHTRPRAIPLAMITMRKSTHGFPFLSHDAYGAPLGSPLGRRSSAINFNISASKILRVVFCQSCHYSGGILTFWICGFSEGHHSTGGDRIKVDTTCNPYNQNNA